MSSSSVQHLYTIWLIPQLCKMLAMLISWRRHLHKGISSLWDCTLTQWVKYYKYYNAYGKLIVTKISLFHIILHDYRVWCDLACALLSELFSSSLISMSFLFMIMNLVSESFMILFVTEFSSWTDACQLKHFKECYGSQGNT